MNKIQIKEIQSKSALVSSKLPDTDYVVNPYTGCSFGCTYCYASFMGRFVGKGIDEWGSYVFAKTNIHDLLKVELSKIKDKGKGKEVFISSVTDPYQGLEARYQLTRKCLEAFASEKFEGLVSMLTKSDLVLRDIDIIKKIKNIEVGLTITSTDDSISRYFEKYAPNVTQRLKALKVLNEEGVKTYAFLGPLLPHFVTNPGEIDKILASIKEAGTKELYIEHINLSNYILGRLKKEMKGSSKEIMDQFYASRNKDYRKELDEIIGKLLKKHGLKLRLNETIYHKESK